MLRLFGRTARSGSSVDLCVIVLAKTALVSIFLAPAAAYGQQREVLSLSDAVALVTGDQPQLEALASQEQAALASARAEAELSDPKLAFGLQNVPVTGEDAFRLGRDDMTMITVGVMQDVVTRRKRQAASERMSAEARRLLAERELADRTIRRDVAFVWIDAFEAQRRAASLRKLLADMMAERQVGARTLVAGTTPSSDVLRLDMELSLARDELILAERDEARARAMLARWIGDDALRPLPDGLPHELDAEIDTARAVDALGLHPALQSAAHAVDVALREVDRARAERTPDWGWQLMYGQRPDDRSDMVTLQFNMGLPFNRADRQDRRITEKLAQASAMRSDIADRQRVLQAELAAVEADLNASARRLREHEEHRIPSAQARLDTSQATYGAGAGSLLEVWQARRAWIEVSLHHEMILAERARSLTKLAWLTGQMEVLP